MLFRTQQIHGVVQGYRNMRILLPFAKASLIALLAVTPAVAQDNGEQIIEPPRPDLFFGPLEEGGRYKWQLLPRAGKVRKFDFEVGSYAPIEDLDCRQVAALIAEEQKELFDLRRAIAETDPDPEAAVNIYNMGIDHVEAQAWVKGLEAEIKRAQKAYDDMAKEINNGNPYDCHVGS